VSAGLITESIFDAGEPLRLRGGCPSPRNRPS
jgi:hypothetical protein